jgi:hypothetical protein
VNNSLPRLLDGMVATLREAILPYLEDDFARGQAFGVIYMLTSIKRRAAWSNEFLGEQLQALQDLSHELTPLAQELAGAPRPQISAPANLPSAVDLETLRDAGNASVCDLIDWLSDHRAALPSTTAERIDDALHSYMIRQLKWDISTSAKPMFEEISRGAEADPQKPRG